MSDADLSAIIHDPNVLLFTLEQSGKTQALLELDLRNDNACELAFFGLTKDLIGTGAGRFLMNFAIDTCWNHPISRFHLNTCTLDSPGALDFYIRSGFTAIGRKIEVADDPRNTKGWDKTVAPKIPIVSVS
jgi:GNAT superfamily N-acetyltransferase